MSSRCECCAAIDGQDMQYELVCNGEQAILVLYEITNCTCMPCNNGTYVFNSSHIFSAELLVGIDTVYPYSYDRGARARSRCFSSQLRSADANKLLNRSLLASIGPAA